MLEQQCPVDTLIVYIVQRQEWELRGQEVKPTTQGEHVRTLAAQRPWNTMAHTVCYSSA